MNRVIAACLAALALTVTGACSTLTPWAAKVNGEDIPTAELDRELEAILSNETYLQQVQSANLEGGVIGAGEGTFTTAFVGRILTRQIFFQLIEQEVERRKLTVSGADEQAAADDVIASFGEPSIFRAFPEDYRDELVRRQAQVTVLQAELGEVEVDEAAVQKFYEENVEQFTRTCVSHILVATPEEAAAAKARIQGGEDFATVAQELSTDPGSGANGGELGCVAPGSFVPEFETAMESLPEGQVSDPVQTNFGFHLILVTERAPQPLEEARAEIRQQLLGQTSADFEAFVDEALNKAEIEVNPRYGRFDRESAQPGIIPPTAPTPDSTVPSEEGIPGLPPGSGQQPPPGVPDQQPGTEPATDQPSG
jgi:hypothetical protein